jgi:fructose-bisphosphate aldolase class I
MAQQDQKEQGPPTIYYKNPFEKELRETAAFIATRGKGILAADESTGTIGKRFVEIKVNNVLENRRKYRQLLFTTKDIGKYICGVIMYEETLFQKTDDGTPFPDILKKAGVITGIKVDMGTKSLPYHPKEVYTQGLTDLDVRCDKYYQAGARFAKWRAVLTIQNGYISQHSVQETAWTLASYAAICQQHGLVPIVEPEILMDGDHSIEIAQYWTEKVLSACYKALNDQEVILEGTLLKPNMVLAGEQWKGQRSPKTNALATVTALKRTVPSAVPAIVFLSGGQSEEEATVNLNEINKFEHLPWSASFSYGRALQQSCLQAWKGDDKNIEAAQKVFLDRAKANSEAQLGKYDGWAGGQAAKQKLFQSGYVY